MGASARDVVYVLPRFTKISHHIVTLLYPTTIQSLTVTPLCQIPFCYKKGQLGIKKSVTVSNELLLTVSL